VVAEKSNPAVTLRDVLEDLPAALVAARRELLVAARRELLPPGCAAGR